MIYNFRTEVYFRMCSSCDCAFSVWMDNEHVRQLLLFGSERLRARALWKLCLPRIRDDYAELTGSLIALCYCHGCRFL